MNNVIFSWLVPPLPSRPQASELLTTPVGLIVSMADCRVPEVGRDECILCLSNYSLNEASALVWAGKASSRGGCKPGVHKSPIAFNFFHHKPRAVAASFSKGKTKHFWLFPVLDERYSGLDTFLLIYSVTRGPHLSSTYCTENLIPAHAHHMPDWMD